MSDEFGQYENNGVVDVELGDDFWDVEPNKPLIPEGEVIFYIDHYEPHRKAGSNSFGYMFFFVPYQDQYGMPLPLAAQSKLQKRYFYVGKTDPATNRLVEVAQSNNFQTFLTSVGIIKGGEGAYKFSNENLKGKLVKANVIWKKLLSNRENPNTGIVPTEIDENDPYSYTTVVEMVDSSIRGIRDGKGEVQRVNV